MSTIAKLTLIGHLGNNAELRNVGPADNLRAVLNFSVATQNRKDQPTLWTRCSLWGNRAESLAQYMTKGTLVMVDAIPLPPKVFRRADGTYDTSLEAIANDVVLLSSQNTIEPSAAAVEVTEVAIPF